MAQSLRPSQSAAASTEAAKFNQKLVEKLKYCKEVLISIRNASAGTGMEGGDTGTLGSDAAPTTGVATNFTAGGAASRLAVR